MRKNAIFSKFNLIDLSLVVVVVMVMVALLNQVFPFKTFQKIHTSPSKKVMIVDLLLPSGMEWMGKYVVKGDRQKGIQNRLYADVVDAYYSRDYGKDERFLVRLKVLVRIEPGQLPLILDRYSARIGDLVVFQTEKYILSGNIVKIEEMLDVVNK